MKAVVNELRQIADVVEVAVRDHDARRYASAANGQRDVVERANVDDALKEAAVDEDVFPADGEQMFAAGNGAGGADERDVSHGSPA